MAELHVLSWAGGWGAALRAAVSEPFTRQTGVRVHHHRTVGLALPPAIDSALRDGRRPPVDVVWSNSGPALRAAAAGHCIPLDVTEMPVLSQLRDRAAPGTGGFPFVYAYVVYYVLAYHAACFPDGPPRSWEVLLDRRHRGKIALYPGGNGLYPIAQLMGGGDVAAIPHAMDACWAWIERLSGQVAELDYSIGMEERLRTRQLDLCFRALTNALAFRDAGVPVDWTVPREGTSDTLDALWIPRGVPEETRRIAAQYIAFALRPDVQAAWCARLGAMPMHPDAEVPGVLQEAGLPAHADRRDQTLHVDERVKAAHQEQWESRFSQLVVA